LRNKYDLGYVGSQQLRGLIPLLFENKTMLILCMRFTTKIVYVSEVLYEFRVRDTFRVRDAGKIFENIKAVPQHSSESQ
jgi:hypothetical protein